MCVVAAVAAVGLATTAAGAIEAGQASRSQENAANRAAQTQRDQFASTQAAQQPFHDAGVAATNQLGGIYGLPGYSSVDIGKTISQLPGYQFQLSQGTQAIDRSQAARGLLNSGATGKALTQYGQGLAQNYMGQYVGGLQEMANRGEGATQSTAAAGAGAANQISSAQIYAGNAAAQGDINTFNAISSGLSQGVGLYGMSRSTPSATPVSYGSPDFSSPSVGLPGGYNMNSQTSPWNYQSLTGLT